MPSSHWGCWLIRLVGMRDPRMHRCVARTIARLIDFMNFQGIDEVPAMFLRPTVHWLHFQALHHMKPQKESSDSVGPGRFGGISSSFRAHEKDSFRFPMDVGCSL